MTAAIYTVGHSTHSAARFLQLLLRNDITAIADVRSQPYSRMNPQFNRESLRAVLKEADIAYVFLGRELGARSSDESCYINGKVQYDRLAQTDLFREGLDRVEQGLSKHRIALMCAERDPLTCHRSILVCRHLVARNIGVQHIVDDGRLESHDNALARLLRELKIEQEDLFRNQKELFAEAYAQRGEQIAYVERSTLEASNRASR
jgi:uncharacterized protein (DUF488 family)